nr:MAG TPA: hypothetical protein [Caudoviricetes sp.]DAZ67222.1 MAG TPA: hypothetical protein [Caudoviricetes sp.]
MPIIAVETALFNVLIFSISVLPHAGQCGIASLLFCFYYYKIFFYVFRGNKK